MGVLDRSGSLEIHYCQSYVDIYVAAHEGKRVYFRNNDRGIMNDEEQLFDDTEKTSTSSHEEDTYMHLRLCNGSVVTCDTVVCAIGVEPNLDFIREGDERMKRGKYGALLINERC